MSYAADYIRFSSTIPRDIYIHFDGVDTSLFRLTVIKLGSTSSQIYSIESLSLDSLNSAAFYVDSLGMEVKKIIMVVMNTDPTLGENIRVSYTYSAESIASIEDISDNEFTYNLYQNYPNPFNPTTAISFQLPSQSSVTLKVYDVLGNEVATLVNEEKPAGSYEVEFSAIGGSASSGNAYTLPSGIYFYQLKSNSFIGTKKMVLLK
jgi:hypothetical protein